jgi:hypothetical protein
MKEKFGSLIIDVYRLDDGTVEVERKTDLSEHLNQMQLAMSAKEKTRAVQIRRRACAAAADFFLFVRNPDDVDEVAEGES